MRALAFNPGSASLKFEVIDAEPGQTSAAAGRKLLSAAIEQIGKVDDARAKLSVMEGRETVHTETVDAHDMPSATHFAVDWLRAQHRGGEPILRDIRCVAVRVVHGGTFFDGPARWTDEVRRQVEQLEDLAPLHNHSSLAIIDAVAEALPETPVAAVFDTAFHRTLPEKAWRYPIERETADRHGIRKFGFHGISHRYMLEHYAERTGRDPRELNLVTLHMESGSSACAIERGRSVETSMGLTPLEGLMMGTRSGSVDPAIIPLLMRKESMSADDVLLLLNKRSGMQGIAGELDTRILAKRDDAAARLALEMFTYRVRLMVGAYLAALGEAEAVVFGGGIGEDSPEIRRGVCDGLRGWGLQLDDAVNDRHLSGDGVVSAPDSRLAAYVIAPEECLQMVHEALPVLPGS